MDITEEFNEKIYVAVQEIDKTVRDENMSVITDGQWAARIAKELIKMICTEVR